MEFKQIQIPQTAKHKKTTNIYSFAENPPSNALPLLLYLTNAVFFAAVYFLLLSWRDKIRHSKPLHLLTLSEITALLAFAASFVYFMGFFQSHQQQEHQEEEEEKQIIPLKKKENNDSVTPLKPHISNPIIISSSEEDEEIVKGVVDDRIPSYSLESKLGDCKRAAAIRREALERITGKSLAGLPLEGFDYESILGQCCEVPIGYVQIPVGIVGPLLLDSKEYLVPMAAISCNVQKY